jgi:hypothetical protein
MLFGLYQYAMAAITAALALLWAVQPQWGAFELFGLVVLAFPLYIPLLYRYATKLWVARKRRRLGLPRASDRDIIDFVGEELDRVDVPWQWRVALRKTSHWDEMEVGEDDEPPITVRIHNGVLIVENEEGDAARFIDPVEAVDHILTLYDGRVRLDEDIFIEPEEATG